MPLRSLSADVPEVGVLERELAWLKEHLPQLALLVRHRWR